MPTPSTHWVVPSPLVTPTPLVHQRFHHLSHHRLLLSPSRVSCPTGFHVASRHVGASRPPYCRFTSHHANTSCPPAPPSLFAPPPLIEPLSCLLSDWFFNLLLSCRPHVTPSHLVVLRSCLTGDALTMEDTKTNIVVVSGTTQQG